MPNNTQTHQNRFLLPELFKKHLSADGWNDFRKQSMAFADTVFDGTSWSRGMLQMQIGILANEEEQVVNKKEQAMILVKQVPLNNVCYE